MKKEDRLIFCGLCVNIRDHYYKEGYKRKEDT